MAIERAKTHPGDAATKDGMGRLPLHDALHQAPNDVIHAIIDAHPAACLEKNQNGEFPLQLGLRVGAAADVLDALRKNSTLALILQCSDWAAVERLELATTDTCRMLDQFGNVALHVAVTCEAPLAVIERLIAADPAAIAAKNSEKRTPLEVAIQAGAPLELVKRLLQADHKGLDAPTATGATMRALLSSSESRSHRLLAQTFDAWLGRYKLNPGPPLHKTTTAVAQYGEDVLSSGNVCLKFMKHRDEFEAEINNRFSKNGDPLPAEAVIRILGWHTPVDEPLVDPSGKPQEPEHTCDQHDIATELEEYPYVIVMEQGERSLHDACAKERIAGYDAATIFDIFRQVLVCVQMLHIAGVVHADLKQRNILRVTSASTGAAKWILCDMDASANLDERVGTKTSSGYAPPELARARYANTDGDILHNAKHSFDIWSLGVIFFELCAGHTLFSQDTSNDELIEAHDQTRLCTWHTMDDEMLSRVLRNSNATDEMRSDARQLIRWCLKGHPDTRPTVTDLLHSRLLGPRDHALSSRAPRSHPMKYHGFLSHAQADASGTAGTLYYEYLKLGLHCWIDMRQEKLTLEGMRQGIRDSDVFILVLTERVLSSWFCNAEMMTALDEEKPIQLIIEEESRFHPFKREEWEAQAAAGVDERFVKNQTGAMTAVPPRVTQMIDQHLTSAVPYRRRDYEQRGMMRELCRRNGVALPSIPYPAWPAGVRPLRVAFIANPHGCRTAAAMHADLKQGLQSFPDRIELMPENQSQAQLDTADRIILLLSSGLLQEPALSTLEATVRFDAEAGQERMLPIYYPGDWTFGGREHMSAPEQICAWLNEHEALCYRPKDDSGGMSHHEFGVMLDHMLVKLGAVAGTATGSTEDGKVVPLPIATVREKLASAERELKAREAALRALSLELDAAKNALVPTDRSHPQVARTDQNEDEEGTPPAVRKHEEGSGKQRQNGSCQCCARPH